MGKIIILIPAYKPEDKMLGLLESLNEYRKPMYDGEDAAKQPQGLESTSGIEGIDGIVVVDDGGQETFRALFEQAEAMGCLVVHHEVNRGKGAAIRTGIQAAIEHFGEDTCVVTADADGQHLPEDILRVAAVLREKNCRESRSDSCQESRSDSCQESDGKTLGESVEKNSQNSLKESRRAAGKPALVLGTRNFSEKNVPARSMLGNRITSVFFRLSTGKACADTQTGLRGIPAALLPLALSTDGDRYEYEMNFLTDAVRKSELVQVPIETVYEEGNRTSHFRPVRDSLLIYKKPLRYAATGVGSAVVDWGLFLLIMKILGLSAFSSEAAVGAVGLLSRPEDAAKAAGAAAAAARIGSGLFNFEVNRHWSFQSSGRAGGEAVRYLILFVANMICNACVVALFSYTGIPSALGKFIADVILFVINYQVQKHWVFRKPQKR